MQYLLDETEMSNLVSKAKYEALKAAMVTARKLILANSDFVCPHDATKEEWEDAGGYLNCSGCPISPYNFNEKEESPSIKVEYHESNLICTLSRDYEK
jgi:hypothetical protein